jgi:limonene-1,2-epoxide hydrolase
MNINPTNRRVSVPVCGVLEVRDNKIYSEHEYWDSNTVLQQMGVQLQQTAHA